MKGKLKVEKLGIVLAPTENKFENRSVLNPGVYQEGEFVHLFYRAIDKRLNSSIGYAKLKGPTKVVERWDKPILKSEFNYERKGVEDPRIVKINGTFYMTYVAHDGKNALCAYATSQNLKEWERKGIISPKIQYDSAGKIFLREKLKDRYFMFESYYEEYGGSPFWDIIEDELVELVDNQDIEITTHPDFVIGSLVKRIVDAIERKTKQPDKKQ